ncbi:MAG TPA: YbaK/EbsC family protein [Usitatibacteraceae bacterium]|nr:YbaK/EbsC family protein [Usitatibacteraceae bacterium]
MLDEDQSIRNHPAVRRVAEALRAAGHSGEVTVMSKATHTAAQAAAALGCAVEQIAKSVVFRADDGRTVLVIASGANRVDTRKVEALVGRAIGKADAEFVKRNTGFSIGGVAPLAHLTAPLVLFDRDLVNHDRIWPAAGHPNTMFCIAPADLLGIVGATPADVALDPEA